MSLALPAGQTSSELISTTGFESAKTKNDDEDKK